MVAWKRSLVHAVTRTVNLALRATQISPRGLYARWEKAARAAEGEQTGTYADFTMRDPWNWIVHRDEFVPTRRVPFETIEASIPHDVEALLTRGYGDYMQLPPPEKRYNHEAAVIDFGPYAESL